MLCAVILYINGGTYTFKVDSERHIFGKIFTEIVYVVTEIKMVFHHYNTTQTYAAYLFTSKQVSECTKNTLRKQHCNCDRVLGNIVIQERSLDY